MQEYQYPLDLDWTTDEMVIVMKMWEDLERANEKGINNEAFLKTYQQFKTVVKSIGEEKRLGREFEKLPVILYIVQCSKQKKIQTKL